MVGMEAYAEERRRERKRTRRVGREGQQFLFCCGEAERRRKKKKKKKNEPTYVHNRIFWCLIYFRGVGLVGWMVRRAGG